MMNDLPISSGSGSTVIFGDLTFVQNHNFGQEQVNPMMRMQMAQQQLMIQQQQQQNQMLMLGMAGMAKAVKEVMSLGMGQTENVMQLENAKEPLAVEYTVKDEDDGFRVKPKKISTIFDTAEEIVADYEIIEDKPVNTPKHSSGLIPKHMKEFFDENGDVCVQTNKFFKVSEDNKTFAIFINSETLKYAYEWKDMFRKAYLNVVKSTFKTPEMSSMSDKDAKFIAVAFKKSVKHIAFVFKDEIMQKDACIEYVTDTHQEFKSIMYFVSPEVQDGVSNPLNIDSFQAHKEQSLFGDGFYITKDSM